jgi:predicted RNA-binding protein Jag
MKSIMEQASSIIKAIEKAWISADKPKEFSVKIFEHEEKNFFGMTTKPAKIGIFFSDKATSSDKTHKARVEMREQRLTEKESHKQHRQAAAQQQHPIAKQTTQENKRQRVEKQKTVETTQQHKVAPQRISATWNDTMINAVAAWLTKTLSLMGIQPVSFTNEVSGKVLKLTFSHPLIEDPATEKQLFRSAAHLVMASLRNQYKQEIKDLKIVLIRPIQ